MQNKQELINISWTGRGLGLTACVVTASKNGCAQIHHTLTELGWKDAAAAEIKTAYFKYLSDIK